LYPFIYFYGFAIKYFGNRSKAVQVRAGIDSVVTVVNNSMSTYIPESDISKINSGDTAIVVDQMFKEVFALSRKVNQSTQQYFDPTVGGLRNAYGFGDTKPLEEMDSLTLDSMMQYVGLDKIEITEEGTVIKKYPEMYLDFNAVAKGYGIDRIAVYLESIGADDFLIELGGEIYAKGANQNSEKPWSVGVENIYSSIENRQHRAVVYLKDKAMAGSGNYRKNRVDSLTGKLYVHTINPLTGKAEKIDILSASVIANTCAEADAYATSFMAMGIEKSKEALSKLDDVEAYLVFSNGENVTGTYVTGGFEKMMMKQVP